MGEAPPAEPPAGNDAARLLAAALARARELGSVDKSAAEAAQLELDKARKEADAAKRRLLAWQSFCKALMASNEFIYVN